jgi:FtsP/CotA-like multicopper oxidase with cupredoxin domain
MVTCAPRLIRALRGVALVLVAAAVVARLAGADAVSELREFRGSYPRVASPTGVVRAFAIRAAPTELRLLDGRPLRVWAYNDQVPGPTLRIRLGETVRVTFTNDLPQPTTIHWHGVRVPNAMDGVPGVTQPPVRPGETFVYEFTPKDAGTFWFHPHLRSSEQIERGLFGVLIVEDRAPRPYTRDVVWVLDDWLLTDRGEIFPQFNTRHDLAHDGRWGNVVTVNGRTDEQLVVSAGERIRLRLLNVANGRVFLPDLAGLDAVGIAVDGMYAARPFDPAGFELAPGNRLDLDVTIPAERRGSRFRVRDVFTRQPIHLADIVVDDATVATPAFASPAAAHVPVWPDAITAPLRTELHLDARAGGPFGIQWTINGVAFDHEGHEAHATQFLPDGEWSKLRFTNDSFRLHPMHIHGLFFKLLARNGTRVDEPHWRDTVLLHAKETVDVGVVPLDPGLWMLHCHILEHAESGMMTLVEVR